MIWSVVSWFLSILDLTFIYYHGTLILHWSLWIWLNCFVVLIFPVTSRTFPSVYSQANTLVKLKYRNHLYLKRLLQKKNKLQTLWARRFYKCSMRFLHLFCNFTVSIMKKKKPTQTATVTAQCWGFIVVNTCTSTWLGSVYKGIAQPTPSNTDIIDSPSAFCTWIWRSAQAHCTTTN